MKIKLRLEPRIVLNGLQALIHGHAGVKLDPLAGVPHERQCELGITDVLHASEFFLESWRNGIGARAGVNGNEVARRANPLGRDVGDVIELAAFERRLDVPGLESFLDQFSGLGVHFVLERARHSGLGGFGWVEPPCFSLLCHRDYSFRLLPCLPFQNGQNGQSSPCGKSSPSSCGHPILRSVATTELTPYFLKNSCICRLTFGLSITLVPIHRSKIGSAPSRLMTPATILVVIWSFGP